MEESDSLTLCFSTPRLLVFLLALIVSVASVACAGASGDAGNSESRSGTTPADSTSSGDPTPPEVTMLVQDSPEHQMFLKTHDDAASASGSWSMDGDLLRFAFRASTFACDGPASGDEGVFMIVELGDTMLIMQLDNDDPLEFVRVGAGQGLLGTWQMTEGDFVITFIEDGSVVASGGQECAQSTRQDDTYYTDEGCLASPLGRSADIQVDGHFDDWQADGRTADGVVVVDDDDGEEDPVKVPGADLRALRVAANSDRLFLLLEVHDALNPSFQGGNGEIAGMYEITIQHDGGSAGGTFGLQLVHDGGDDAWRVRGPADGVEIAAGASGLEASVRWAALGGATQVYQVGAVSRDCNDGPGSNCVIWDTGPCFAEVK